MRVIIVVFACLLGAAALSPFFVGSKIETSVRDYVGQFEDLPLYKIAIEDYKKGYLKSDVIISVGLDPILLEAMTADLELDASSDITDTVSEGAQFYLNIQHGPLLTEDGFTLGWAHMNLDVDRENYPELEELFDLIETDTLLETDVHVGLSGDGWAKSVVPDMDIELSETADEKLHFVMRGWQDDSTFTNYGAAWEQNAGIDEISMTVNADQNIAFSIKNMAFDSEMIVGNPIWLSLSETVADIESVEFSSDEFSAEMNNLQADIVMREGDTSDTITIYESFRMADANFNGHQVKNADFSFSYVNVSKEIFQIYIDSIGSMATIDEEQIAAEMQEKFAPAIENALAYDPRFNLDKVAFEYGDGHFNASASMGIKSGLLQFPLDMENPMVLLPAGDMYMDLSLNESMVRTILIMQNNIQMAGIPEEERPDEEQVEQMVDQQIGMFAAPLVQQGFIKQEGDEYSATFTFSEGSALVNGMPIPIPGF